MKKLLTPTLWLTLLYCLVGPMSLYVEQWIWGRDALWQAPVITLLAIGFLIYTFCSLLIFHRLQEAKDNVPSVYYLADKMLRLLLSAIALAVYGFMARESVLHFAINLFVLYLTTMVFTNIYCIRQEKKQRNK